MFHRRFSKWFLLVAWASLLALPASGQHSAVQPVPRGDSGWKDRANLLNQRVKELPDAELLFIGDSITQGWEGAGKEIWEKHYAGRKAINLGIGGDRTQHVLWRLENGNLAGIRPKVAVVMIGTNNSNGEDNTPGQIVDGIRAIIARLRENQPQMKILLLAIFPRGENFNPQRGKVCQVNQVLQKLDDGRQVHFLDIGHHFLTPEGILPAALMPDFLHLSPEGYALWARAIEPKLAEWLGPSGVAAAGADPSGEWIWKIRGPDGQDVEAPLILKVEGSRVTGRFARGEGRWLEIEEGRIEANRMSWRVKRDRPSGGEMVYQMSATLEGDKLVGKVTTEMDGNKVDSDWSGRRK